MKNKILSFQHNLSEHCPKWLKKLAATVTNNFFLKLMSVLIAVLMWAYVISETNPERTHVFHDVGVTVSGVQTLAQAGYALVDLAELREMQVDVTLAVYQNEINQAGKEQITVMANVGNISSTGKQTVRLSASTSTGRVVRVSPSQVEMEVDVQKEIKVPITCAVKGSAATGYWEDVPELTKTEVEVSGPASVIDRIASAKTEVMLHSVQESYNATHELKFYDADGDRIDTGSLNMSTSTVGVTVPVYPFREIELGEKLNIAGTVAEGYEITEIVCSPQTLLVAGPRDVLDQLDHILLDAISVEGLDCDKIEQVALRMPSGVQYINYESVEVVIKVAAKNARREFTCPVALTRDGHSIGNAPEQVTVTLSGPEPDLIKLDPSAITAAADVTGLSAGMQAVPVKVTVSDAALSVVKTSPDKVTAVIE